MASSFIYNDVPRAVATKEVNFAADTFVAILCMANTTCDTSYDETDATDDTAFDYDEFDGSGYTTGGHTLTVDAPEADGTGQDGFASSTVTALTLTSLTAGTRDLAGVMIKDTTTTPDLPVAWLDYAGGTQPDGTNWTMASFKFLFKTKTT